MNGKTLLAEAIEMKDEIVENRRAIHRAPEVGAHLPQTVQFVEEKLRLLGYEPRELGGGVVAELTGEDMGRCILLRADMDALKVREKTDLPFRSENGSMHACGHDMHAAMLLGAARLLKAHQSELKGTVKLVFQPDEEGFTGAKAMLKAGVLEVPKPQAAMALHVNSGTPSGLVLCGKGTFMAGCTLFRITVKGVGCHGAMPETGVDPINIAAHIYLALQEITARELPAKTPAIVTMGKFSAGHAPNIIPQEAVIEGTIRTFDRDVTALILRRIGASENADWDSLCKFGLLPREAAVTVGAPLFPRIDAQKELAELEALHVAAQAPAADPLPEPLPPVSFDDFCKVEMTVVKVLTCEKVKKSEKLLKFTLDDGTGTPRQILSGIAKYYQPEELLGKTLVAVTNLPPRKMMGQESCGMLLSAERGDKLNLVMLDDKVPAGSRLV